MFCLFNLNVAIRLNTQLFACNTQCLSSLLMFSVKNEKKLQCALAFISLPVCIGKRVNLASHMMCFWSWLFLYTFRKMVLQFGVVCLLAVHSRVGPLEQGVCGSTGMRRLCRLKDILNAIEYLLAALRF